MNALRLQQGGVARRRRPTPRPRGRTVRGFTLVELLVTVVIVAMLASGAMSLYQIAATRSREADLRAALRDIRGALDAYKVATDNGLISKAADASGYPPSLGILASGVSDATSPLKKKLFFLRRVPRDPFADPSLPADQTWGLRSYASPPDDPSPGDDVFDVYSLSTRTGLNGIPYRQW